MRHRKAQVINPQRTGRAEVEVSAGLDGICGQARNSGKCPGKVLPGAGHAGKCMRDADSADRERNTAAADARLLQPHIHFIRVAGLELLIRWPCESIFCWIGVRRDFSTSNAPICFKALARFGRLFLWTSRCLSSSNAMCSQSHWWGRKFPCLKLVFRLTEPLVAGLCQRVVLKLHLPELLEWVGLYPKTTVPKAPTKRKYTQE